MKHAKATTTARALIRDWPHARAEAQRKAARRDGATVIYDARAGQRDAWIRALRPGEVAWIYDLALLAEPATSGTRPASDMAHAAARLSWRLSRGAVLVVGKTGQRIEREADLVAFADAAGRVAAGRNLSPQRARQMGRAGRDAAIERSAASLIKRPDIAPLVPTLRAVWRSAEYAHREDAAAAVNDILRERDLPPLGGWQTIYRLWGGRGRRK